VQANERGELSPERLEAQIRSNTRAVIITAASNVCGTIMPIASIGEICRRRGLRLIVDSAQTAGLFPINMKEDGIDALAFSGHKGLLGPQGIGGLCISDEIAGQIDPVISGETGSMSDSEVVPPLMPDKLEAGTLNLPSIAGLHAAFRYLRSVGISTLYHKETEITRYFLNRVGELRNARIAGLGDAQNRTAVVSLDFPGRDNAQMTTPCLTVNFTLFILKSVRFLRLPKYL
jgi:selenocysteine lyase/cysteine desulfurase